MEMLERSIYSQGYAKGIDISWNVLLLQVAACVLQQVITNDQKIVYLLLCIALVAFLHVNKRKRIMTTKQGLEKIVPVALLAWFSVSVSIVYPLRGVLLANAGGSMWSVLLSPLRLLLASVLYILGLPFSIKQGLVYHDQEATASLDLRQLLNVLVFCLTCVQIICHELFISTSHVKLLKEKYTALDQIPDKTTKNAPKVDPVPTTVKNKPVNVTKPLNVASKPTIFPKKIELPDRTPSFVPKKTESSTQTQVKQIISKNNTDLSKKETLTNGHAKMKIQKTVEISSQCSFLPQIEKVPTKKLEYTTASIQCALLVKQISSEKETQSNIRSFEKETQSSIQLTDRGNQFNPSLVTASAQTVLVTFQDKLTQCYDTTPSYNKSIQVNMQLSTRKSKEKLTQTEPSLSITSETQTESNVYDIRETEDISSKRKITARRSFSKEIQKKDQECQTIVANVPSARDVDRITYSVTTLSEKTMKQTEPIRFKACKSQHGVWYASLRADVFLTVSQQTLKTIKMLEDREEIRVSDDIVRTMKMFVDNYNKLSDCFDDETETDDESFINGFRL